MLAYLPVWRAGFIWDDDTFLLTNPLIQKSDGLQLFWFSTAAPDYFPVTSTTLWLEWRLWGLNPLGYHLVNVLLHALGAIILWRLLAALKLPGAGLAAALFAVHPVNVESVAWVTERKNTLSMVFYLLSIFSFVRFAGTCEGKPAGDRKELENTPGYGRGKSSPACFYVFSLVAFLLGLLSKSAIAPLPIVLLGIIWWRQGRVTIRDLLQTVPFFAVALAAGLVSIWFQYHRAIGASMVVVRHDGFLSRLAGAGWAVWFYLFKALVPLNLGFVYPKWHIDAGRLDAWLPDLLLLLVFAVCWRFRQCWGKAVLFGLGYFVVMLLPVLGFLNIYFMRYSLVADHWQYFAIIGPIVLVAGGMASLGREAPRWLPPCIATGLVALLGFLTWQETRVYRNVESLWIRTLDRNPDAILALNNLGNLRLQENRLEEAAACFQKALAIQSDAPDVLCNLGATRLRQGRLKEAEDDFRRALKLEPGSAQAHHNLGEVLMQQGEFNDALLHFRKVAEIQPNSAAVEDNLGAALLRAGAVDEALVHLNRAVQLQPDLPDARIDLGNALARNGQIDPAIVHLRKVVELRPSLAAARYNLANAILQKGDLDAAATEFRRASEIEPGFAGPHNGLGNVLLRQGETENAINEFRQALRLAPDLAEAHFNLANLLLGKGDLDEAIVLLEKGLVIQPNTASAHNNLASALLQKGRRDDAIIHLKTALRIQPDLPQAQNNLANALLGKGQVAEAVRHYEAALAMLPENPYLLNNLAWVLATCPDASIRNGSRALELARKANELAAGKSPAILGTVAAALAELGRFSDATQTAQQAFELATAQNNASQINSLGDRLALYKNGLPYRDSELIPRSE